MKEHFTDIFRPKNLSEFIGQKHILNSNSFLMKAIQNKNLPHLFLYGTAGIGKTTLAYIIATELEYDFFNLNATTLSVKEIREIVDRYENSFEKPLIFIDEIHRLSKRQQEVLLPIMEFNRAIIIGASTDNLYFSMTDAIKSRGILLKLHSLKRNDLNILLDRVIEKFSLVIDKNTREYLLDVNSGDARSLLIHIELAYQISPNIDLSILKSIKNSNSKLSKVEDSVSSLISALIKSIRGTDLDASIYYLILLIEKGEKADYIARRLVILASEDIGNANPNALNLAVNTLTAVKEIGYPEAKIILSQCVIFLASCPKSNSVGLTIDNVYNSLDKDVLQVPHNIKKSSTSYKNPHYYGGFLNQQYLQKKLELVKFKPIGFEKTLLEWIAKIKSIGRN